VIVDSRYLFINDYEVEYMNGMDTWQNNSRTTSRHFNDRSVEYAGSAVHASGEALRLLPSLMRQLGISGGELRICDVGCGPGHTALALAARTHILVGVDPAPAMLATSGAAAQRLGVKWEGVEACAESIPLPDNSFDLTVTRLAAHHFIDIERSVAEMARITKSGGFMVVIDLEEDEDPECAALNHYLECLHDPTHVRSYSLNRWRALIEYTGFKTRFAAGKLNEFSSGLSIDAWCDIARTGVDAKVKILDELHRASDAMLAKLHVIKAYETYAVQVRVAMIITQNI